MNEQILLFPDPAAPQASELRWYEELLLDPGEEADCGPAYMTVTVEDEQTGEPHGNH
jgi:hypothetical protein